MARLLRPRLVRAAEPTPRSNRLLASLPQHEFEAINSKLERVTFRSGEPLHDPSRAITHAFFVSSGLVSRLATMETGEQVEVGLIGNEGLIGSQVVLGSAISMWRTISQAGSTVAYSLSADCLVHFFRHLPVFQRKVLRFITAQASILTQIAACNCIHDAEDRLARWLLMCQDRVGTEALPLTQEFLSQMLGVQRTTVTLVAHGLHESGVISYSRGKIVIMDRRGLEANACECYAAVRQQHLALLADLEAAD